jgi:hypothetical protein
MKVKAMKETEELNLEEILTEALEDEYKSRARYRKIIDKLGPVEPFVNIAEAEDRHISVLLPLFEQHGIPIPEEPGDESSLQIHDTLLEACEAGVRAEKENIALYDRLIASTRQTEVLRVLRNLQSTSRDRHLPAFQRCAKRSGVAGPGGTRCTGDQRRARKDWSKK